MNKFWMVLAAGLFAFGCDDKPNETGAGEADADTDSDTDADTEVDVTWGSSSVDLTITNGDATQSYWFGMAEVVGCPAEDCWTGEDCIYGYAGYAYCHPAATTGVSLAYGAPFDAVTEGVDTVFFDSGFDGSVTYYLEDNTACWVWGADTSYYDGLGCTAL